MTPSRPLLTLITKQVTWTLYILKEKQKHVSRLKGTRSIKQVPVFLLQGY